MHVAINIRNYIMERVYLSQNQWNTDSFTMEFYKDYSGELCVRTKKGSKETDLPVEQVIENPNFLHAIFLILLDDRLVDPRMAHCHDIHKIKEEVLSALKFHFSGDEAPDDIIFRRNVVIVNPDGDHGY